jgi:AcrR family transcriptional regulator
MPATTLVPDAFLASVDDAMERKAAIFAVARHILETQGPEGLTMRAIAAGMGIRAPSLYKHITGKREVEVALITQGLDEAETVLSSAVSRDGEGLVLIAAAYRAWALTHPHLYRLMNDQPLPRQELPVGLEDRAAAPLLAALDGDVDRARAMWAFAHGMVTLEMVDRFPPDADLSAAWTAGLQGIAHMNTRSEHT